MLGFYNINTGVFTSDLPRKWEYQGIYQPLSQSYVDGHTILPWDGWYEAEVYEPQYESNYQRLVSGNWTIDENNFAQMSKSIEDFNQVSMINGVKSECNRRINLIKSGSQDWRGDNLAYEHQTLLYKLYTNTITQEETDELTDLNSKLNEIKRLRVKSNELELMCTSSFDYKLDQYWN